MKNATKMLLSAALAGASIAAGATALPAGAAVGDYTVVIGDSLSNYGRDNLLGYKPAWEVDAVNGSTPATLPGRIDAAVKRHGGEHPGTIVVELGTNYSSSWSGADYGVVRQKLPGTRIVFVTPGRDPFVVGRTSAQRAATYAYHMVRIANDDPRACIVPWAEAVDANPALLRDGVHATAAAEDRWAREVFKGADACAVTEP
jgi:hypothetical protein